MSVAVTTLDRCISDHFSFSMGLITSVDVGFCCLSLTRCELSILYSLNL
jgi:hypothetical protein